MKNRVIYCLFLALVMMVTSCELPDNIDPKNAKEVSPESIFTQAEIALVNQLTSSSVNQNISRLLVQYQSEVTYVTESRYNFVDRQIPDNFSGNIYRGVLLNLKDAKENLEAKTVAGDVLVNQKKNQIALIEVLSVYAYHTLVDAFGDIPYTEALMGAENSRPKYDDALTVYLDLISRLDDAIASMETGYASFGSADLLYGGDVALWKKFAATLKFRLGMRLSDVPSANPGTIVSEALATGVFTDQAESAIWVPYGMAPYVGPYYQEFVLNARKDFTPTNTIVDLMNTLNDPRRAIWFTQYPGGSGNYLGLPYGKMGASNYNSFSHFSDMILFDPKYSTILADYVEVEFLLAEAAERNFAGITNPGSHYRTAILTSMEYWGVSDADANAYLAQPEVSYGSATGDYKEKIGTQKWLGLFDRGVEAWAEWRRLDFPVLYPPAGMTYADIPTRMPYPYNEDTQNKTNYEAAASAIGGDEATTRLFWDID